MLMLGECDGKRLTLKFVLNCGYRTLVKIFNFLCVYGKLATYKKRDTEVL